MNSAVCFLLTILDNDMLIKCALCVDNDQLGGDAFLYPMEPENRQQIHNLLPEDVRKRGPIVDVEEISYFIRA